jgi:pyrophosphatase PpaX
MLQTILFDLDGTLIDTMDLIVACWQHATTVHCGAPAPRENILPTIGLPLVAALDAYAPGRGEALYTSYHAYNQEWHDQLARLVPGTREMLAALRAAGVRVGLVTSKRHEILQMGLDLFGLGAYLDVVVGLEDSTRHKPDPEPLLTALARLGQDADRGRVAYVGDAAGDMACARAAGVRPIGVPWGAAPTAVLQDAGADPVIGAWADLLALALEKP